MQHVQSMYVAHIVIIHAVHEYRAFLTVRCHRRDVQ